MTVYVLLDIHNDLEVLGVFGTLEAAQQHQATCRHYPSGGPLAWFAAHDGWADQCGGRLIFARQVQGEG